MPQQVLDLPAPYPRKEKKVVVSLIQFMNNSFFCTQCFSLSLYSFTRLFCVSVMFEDTQALTATSEVATQGQNSLTI